MKSGVAQKDTPLVQLPTDEKLASEGIVEFEKMITSLPEELGEKARNDEDLFKTYCGIFPPFPLK